MEHPAPCRLETEPIREEQVEALRAGRDDADQKQRTAAEACQEAQISLEHESRRRIEIQGKLYGQNQDSPAAQPDTGNSSPGSVAKKAAPFSSSFSRVAQRLSSPATSSKW